MADAHTQYAAQQVMQQGLTPASCSAFGTTITIISAAAAAVLHYAGLLSSMHASLVPVMQAITQQWSSTAGGWTPYKLVLDTARAIMRVTGIAVREARALVPAELQHAALHSTQMILGQVQDCGMLLAAASTGAGGAGSSSSSSRPHRAYVDFQCAATGLVFNLSRLQQLPEDCALQVQQLLVYQAAQELLLQPLVARVAMLHQHHEAHQQQQEQQQQHKAGAVLHVLPIPAFHLDMLLPGGQAYLDAAAAVLPALDADEGMHDLMLQINVAVAVLAACLHEWGCSNVSDQTCNAAMLSPAAVRLMLELQLLVAGEVQRQQQQQPTGHPVALALLSNCNIVLAKQIRTAMRHSGSCLPPEVLQQAGLQLLQALAAPVQLLKLCDWQAVSSEVLPMLVASTEQLYALRAAAEQVTVADDGSTRKLVWGLLPCSAAGPTVHAQCAVGEGAGWNRQMSTSAYCTVHMLAVVTC
jgi:hypothetical protein